MIPGFEVLGRLILGGFLISTSLANFSDQANLGGGPVHKTRAVFGLNF